MRFSKKIAATLLVGSIGLLGAACEAEDTAESPGVEEPATGTTDTGTTGLETCTTGTTPTETGS